MHAPENKSLAANQITQLIDNMSLEEKVGQLLIIGHWNQYDDQRTANMVTSHALGGVIIMQVDNDVVDTVPNWTSSWQTASTIPLLISIDQEGGVVSRLRTDDFIQTKQRDITTQTEAYAVGVTRGTELSALGINANLAPVLDFAGNNEDFLYERSFADAKDIPVLAKGLIDGHNQSNVLSVPKHFPGHGSTPADSHITLPIVDIPSSTFADHVQQFKELLTTEPVGAIMTAHVQFPQIDSIYPATLSHKILTNELRETIGFNGVVMTDDMTMGAITNQWTTNEAAVLTILAGADMILFAADPDAAMGARDYIITAINTGDLPEKRIDESVQRILKLKQDQGLLTTTPSNSDPI
jgi:beta-N-acetylhexosaminidase